MRKKEIYLSNLAWQKRDTNSVIKIIKDHKLNGIDFAPLQITNNWKNIIEKTYSYSKYLKKNKIKVNAIQGIFYKKNFRLFLKNNNLHNLINHMKIIIKLCKILNSQKIVIGSSEFRNKFKLKTDDADVIFIDFFNQILPLLKKNNIFICLETIPKEYNETYLYKYDHAVKLVKKINSKYLKINFDTSIFHFQKLNFEKFIRNVKLVKNIQITEKNFQHFNKPSKKNILFCKKLKKLKQINSLSLEIISKKTNLPLIEVSLKKINKLLT